MNKIEIAKAEVNFWKTHWSTSIFIILSLSIAYWQTKEFPLANKTFAILSFVSLVLFFLSYLKYSFANKKLIDECRK